MESANQTQASPGPPRRKVNVRTLLWAGAIVVVLLFLGRSILQSQGIGGSSAGTTGPTAAPTAAAPTATPQLTHIQGQQVVGAPGPIILMNPGIVREGTSVSVSGFGFDPQAQMDLLIKQQGSDAGPGQSVETMYTDKGGSFTATFPLPAGLPAGPFVLVARERNSDKAAQATGSESAGAAFVKMGAQVGKVGDVVGWSGSGFAPGESVNVYWNALGGQPIATFRTDGGGSIKATVQVPFAAVGENAFIFVGTKSQSPVTASFLILSLYPTVKPSSYALQADNPLSFSGSGFGPNERVLIFLNSTTSAPLGTAQADAHGSFTTSEAILIPYTLKGKQTLVFIGEKSRAPTTFTFTVLPYNPVAQASIYGGLPGTTLSFYASSFGRDEIVHVYLGRGQGGGGSMVACFKTDDKGRAGAAGSYTIPGNAQTGKMVFTLVGSLSGASAAATVTVMPSTVPVQVPAQPPFTCPLDQPAQTPTPGAGAPGQSSPGASATPGGQASPPAGGPPTGRIPGAAAVVLRPVTVLQSGIMDASTSAHAVRARTLARALGASPAGSRPRHRRRSPDSFRDAFTAAGLCWLGLTALLSLVMVVRLGRRREDSTWLDVAYQATGDDGPTYRRTALPGSPSPGGLPLVTRMVTPKGTGPDGGACISPSVGPRGASPSALHAAPEMGRRAEVMRVRGDCGPMDEIAGVSEVGAAHRGEVNQDHLLMAVKTLRRDGNPTPCGLLVLADGLSGCADGYAASRMATEVIADRVTRALAGEGTAGAMAVKDLLALAVAEANAELCAQNQLQHVDMAAAVTAALLIGDVAHIVNLGHGRAYTFNPTRGLRQVTIDHTLIAGLVSARLLPPAALYTHPRRRQVHRCVGRPSGARIDTFRVVLGPDDLLLMCSNGLWEMVADAQIESLLQRGGEPSAAVERLVDASNRNGGADDVSVVVARPLLHCSDPTTYRESQISDPWMTSRS